MQILKMHYSTGEKPLSRSNTR